MEAMERESAAGAADASRLKTLEAAIRENRREKKDLPDCPCWGNAAQWVDAELYAVLDGVASEPAGDRPRALEAAIRKHREDKRRTPPCTCWMTPTEKADAKLYVVLESLPGRTPVDGA